MTPFVKKGEYLIFLQFMVEISRFRDASYQPLFKNIQKKAKFLKKNAEIFKNMLQSGFLWSKVGQVMLNQFGIPVKDYRRGSNDHKRQKHVPLVTFLGRIVHFKKAGHRKERARSISTNRGGS